MATNVRGRSGSRTRGMTGSFGQGRIGRIGGSTRHTTRSKGRTRTVPTPYKNCNQTFSAKIDSFRKLVQQTQGPAKGTRPSPTTLNTFANWINKGAIVQTISPTQVAKFARNTRKNFNVRNATPTACKNVLAAKFGKNAIKAVARTKTGSFMVACTPTVNFPK